MTKRKGELTFFFPENGLVEGSPVQKQAMAMAILWWRPSRNISSFRSSENDTLSLQIIQTLPIYTLFVKKKKKTFFCLLMLWSRLVLHMWPWIFPLPRYHCSWVDGAGWQASLQPLGRASLEFALSAVKMSKFALWPERSWWCILQHLLNVGHSIPRKASQNMYSLWWE